MIPKKLHHIWWGRKLPKLEQKWMDTSIKNNPEYEHKIWTNKDVVSCKFLEVAIKEKKFAYAADYIRTYVLYHNGGVYIDTDMELVNPIPEKWLDYSVVLPKETDFEFGGHFIATAKKNRFIKNMLDEYLAFDGDTIDIDEWVIPILIRKMAIKTYGQYSILNAMNAEIRSNRHIFCVDFEDLCPYYPWDKSRCGEFVAAEFAIGVHYWNTYKKENGLKLESFDTKYFDDE
jgi:hypothetical protein